jgi:hypothetical protein
VENGLFIIPEKSGFVWLIDSIERTLIMVIITYYFYWKSKTVLDASLKISSLTNEQKTSNCNCERKQDLF